MITITKTDSDNKLVNNEEIEKGCWLHLTDPTKNELEQVARLTNIPIATLKVATDPEEFSHIDIDVEDGVFMVVLDIPVIEKENKTYMFSTIPIGMIYNKDYFVSVCLKETSIINDIRANRVKDIDTTSKVKLLLQIVQRAEFKYLQYLKRIDKNSNNVQQRLQESVKNNELIDLLNIEKSLVYFSTSLTGNDRVLFKIQRSQKFMTNEEDIDLIEDVINDNKQAIEMCNIYRDILSGTMNTYASVISNNLNIIMKTLTLLTIVMTIPTIIASLWGMNVQVPFMDSKYSFYVLAGISALLAVTAGVLLTKMSNSAGGARKLMKRRRKK